jgi:hypothetical protein
MRWRILVALRALFVRAGTATAAAPQPIDPKAAYRAQDAARKRVERAAKKTVRTHPDARPDAPSYSPLREELKKERRVGTRIADDFQPDEQGRQLGVKTFGDQLSIEIDSFRDYWLAKTGEKALRTDWQAQWRWWCRNKHKQLPLPLDAELFAIDGGRKTSHRTKHRDNRNESVSAADAAAEIRELVRKANSDLGGGG